MTQPSPPKTLPQLLGLLEDRSYKTYHNRLKAFERLHRRGMAWNGAMIASATATTVASIGTLVDKNMYGQFSDVLLAGFAVASLATSLVISSLDYPGRSVRMEMAYKEIQQLSVDVESLRAAGTFSHEDYQHLASIYGNLVRHTENHTTADHHESLGKWSWSRLGSFLTSITPWATCLLPVLLIAVFVFKLVDNG